MNKIEIVVYDNLNPGNIVIGNTDSMAVHQWWANYLESIISDSDSLSLIEVNKKLKKYNFRIKEWYKDKPEYHYQQILVCKSNEKLIEFILRWS
jgi:hypothetical protein